jgi:hypothetical protein
MRSGYDVYPSSTDGLWPSGMFVSMSQRVDTGSAVPVDHMRLRVLCNLFFFSFKNYIQIQEWLDKKRYRIEIVEISEEFW